MYGNVSHQPTKGTHRVNPVNENYFDSFGCSPLKVISDFVVWKKWKLRLFQKRIRKNDSYCAAYCLYNIYLTEKLKAKKNESAV